MPRAKLAVELPREVWPRRVTERFDTRLEVVSALTDGSSGTAVVEIAAATLHEVVAEIETDESVSEVVPLRVVDDNALVQVETARPVLLQALTAERVPFDTPLVVRDGEVELTVTAARTKIAALGDRLSAAGLSYDLLYVHESVDPADLLTVPQRELLVTAIEMGYYDTPRECTLTELADAVGVAKSSASERLHRAESRVIRHWAAEAFLVDEAPEEV